VLLSSVVLEAVWLGCVGKSFGKVDRRIEDVIIDIRMGELRCQVSTTLRCWFIYCSIPF
jgi:hypothetical protein